MTANKAGRGFTLVEMLVVVLIMGLLLGLVSVTVRPDERGVLQLEADRLAQLLHLALIESRTTGKAIGWTADDTGYRFWRLTERSEGSAWSEIRDSDLMRPRTLPQGMSVSVLEVENMRPQGAGRLAFSPYAPPLFFTLEIALGAERYRVTASPSGAVRALPLTGAGHAAL